MKEVKQECCNDMEARDGQGRRRTYRTFSPWSHAGHLRWILLRRQVRESPRKMQDEQEVTSEAS